MLPAASSVLLPLACEGGRYALRYATGEAAFAVSRALAFEPFLYCTPRHLGLQRGAGQPLGFYLEDQRHDSTVATYQLFVDAPAQTAHSPWQAPFGAVQLASGLPAALVLTFLEGVHQVLKAFGVRYLWVRGYPFVYDQAGSAQLTHAFLHLGYRVVLAELNHHLPLTEAGFEAGLHVSERRRLLKCRRHGFRFGQEPPEALPEAYDFLRRCRAEKGQQLSLSLDRLQELFQQFPDNHFLFSVRDGAGEWAALTVAIQVSSRALYNFYPASPLAYNAFSPVVQLNEGLCAFGRTRGHQLVDLGTSSLPEGPNHSLLHFKRHLGGVPSLKLTFELDLGA